MDVAQRQTCVELVRRSGATAPVRAKGPPKPRLADRLATRFPQQVAVIQSRRRKVAALCTRRAGKTELCPDRIFRAAEEHPGTVIYYVAITGRRARELMWRPLTQVNDAYGLGFKTNDTRQTLSRPDGTEIRLVGADDMRELEKRRGDKASLVVVDEAQSFPSEILRALVEDVLGPALVDVLGDFLIIGTPGPVCAGYWYELTRNEDDESRSRRDAAWEVWEWSALDNPHVAENVAAEIAERDATRGEDDPSTLREWRGRWVNDAGALFYAYDSRRHDYDGTLPPGHTWVHVMGVDLGHDDAFAIQVWAFAQTCPDIYEVDSFKQSGLTPAQWAQRIRERMERWLPASIVVDTGGLGKAIVVEWQTREALPVEAAEKTNKSAYASLLNGDLREGRIHVLRDGNLAREWSVLPRDPDSPPHKPPSEDPRFPNHSADAALYSWREALHWLGRHPDDKPPPGSEDDIRAQAEAHEERLMRELQQQRQEEYAAW